MQLAERMLKWIYPSKCAICETILPVSENPCFCETCKPAMKPLEGWRCRICGAPAHTEECANCLGKSFQFERNISSFLYDDVCREVIHKFKYKKKANLGSGLGCAMADAIGENGDYRDFSCIIPVPIHENKRQQRGYNQAELLAKPISFRLGIAMKPEAVVRTVDSVPQNLVPVSKRQENVKNVFEWNHNFAIKGKNIIVVDDIFTTGATMNSIAGLLKKNGASRIVGVTLGISVLRN